MSENALNTENFEIMAREYKKMLADYTTSGSDDTVLEKLILILEEQAAVLESLSLVPFSRVSRTVGYLKNLIYRSAATANNFLGKQNYIPSYRSEIGINEGNVKAMNSLFDLQTDIFVLLDKLKKSSAEKQELVQLENRKIGLLASLV